MKKEIDPILASILNNGSQMKSAASIPLVGQEQPACNVSPELRSKSDGTSARPYQRLGQDVSVIESTADPAIKNISRASRARGVNPPVGEQADFHLIPGRSHEGVSYSTGEINRGAYPYSTKEASFFEKAGAFIQLQHTFVNQLANMLKKAEELPSDLEEGGSPVPPEAVAQAMSGAGPGGGIEEPELSPEEAEVLQRIIELTNSEEINPEVLELLIQALEEEEAANGGGISVPDSDPLIKDPGAGGGVPDGALPKTGSEQPLINLNNIDLQQLAQIVAQNKRASGARITQQDSDKIEQILQEALVTKYAAEGNAEEPPLTEEEAEDFQNITEDGLEEEEETKVKEASAYTAELINDAGDAIMEAVALKQAKLKPKTAQQDQKANQYSQVIDSFLHRNTI
jgi:chorismate mutase